MTSDQFSMGALWTQENPYPPAEGDTRFGVYGTWRGNRVETVVAGMPRVAWTMALWNQTGHDDIRFKALRKEQPKPAANKSIIEGVGIKLTPFLFSHKFMRLE